MYEYIMVHRVVVIFDVIVILVSGVGGVLRFANSFSDHMVLQQAPESAILWGYADVVGETISILKDGVHVASTVTSENPNKVSSVAKWKVKIPPESQHGPFSITAESLEGNVTLHDVMFGDVWICSGQSNMRFWMKQVYNHSIEIDEALPFKNIRMLLSKPVTADTPRDDAILIHSWMKPTRGFIENFSALCFLFGHEIFEVRQYPIGLIQLALGGTRIEAWSSPDALANCQNASQIKPGNKPTLLRAQDPRVNRDSVLWNGMVHPYASTVIKGVIWYQGEANRNDATKYDCTFPAMISDWRKKFHDESIQQTARIFPFGFVQLAPWRRDKVRIGGFPEVRWSQTARTGYAPNAEMPNTFMAVTVDLPDFESPLSAIHPRHKQDIAVRLSLGAQAIAYGNKTVVYQGPLPSSYILKPNQKRLEIVFDRGHANLIVNYDGGFEIFCKNHINDCIWLPAAMRQHGSSSVSLNVSSCPVGYHVTGVRYLWRESPCALLRCPLYGKTNNLPVPPFTQEGPFNNELNVNISVQLNLSQIIH